MFSTCSLFVLGFMIFSVPNECKQNASHQHTLLPQRCETQVREAREVMKVLIFAQVVSPEEKNYHGPDLKMGPKKRSFTKQFSSIIVQYSVLFDFLSNQHLIEYSSEHTLKKALDPFFHSFVKSCSRLRSSICGDKHL